MSITLMKNKSKQDTGNVYPTISIFCRRKMEIAKHQLASQTDYVKKLKKSHTDNDLIEQEQLVEKQLTKRVVRTDTRSIEWTAIWAYVIKLLSMLHLG